MPQQIFSAKHVRGLSNDHTKRMKLLMESNRRQIANSSYFKRKLVIDLEDVSMSITSPKKNKKMSFKGSNETKKHFPLHSMSLSPVKVKRIKPFKKSPNKEGTGNGGKKSFFMSRLNTETDTDFQIHVSESRPQSHIYVKEN